MVLQITENLEIKVFQSCLTLVSWFSGLPSCHPSFLLIPLFLVQHCLNHLESAKVHFSSILTKALRTDGRTDGPTDKDSYRDADASKNSVSPESATIKLNGRMIRELACRFEGCELLPDRIYRKASFFKRWFFLLEVHSVIFL